MKKKGIILAGFGGVGKTALAEKYKNVVDLEVTLFKYDYANVKKEDYEKLKGNRMRVRRNDYPQNYFDAIKQAVKIFDIVCVQYPANESNGYYDEFGQEIVLCLPCAEEYAGYENKFRARGNSDEWIEKNKKYFKIGQEIFEKYKGPKILLKVGQTLEDALIERKFRLLPKRRKQTSEN